MNTDKRRDWTADRSPARTCGAPWAPALIFLCLCLAGLAPARGNDYNEVSVNADSPLSSAATTHGYVEYRVNIVNRSDRAHEVEVAFVSGDYVALARLSRTTPVPAKLSVVVTLLQPALPMEGNALTVSIDGTEQEQRVRLNTSNHANSRFDYYISRGHAGAVLAAQDVSGAMAATGPAPSWGSNDFPIELLRASDDAPQWSGNWLFYTRFTAVALSDRDWDRMTEEARTALRRYTQAGGLLIFIGDHERVREAWSEEAINKEEGSSAGFGEVQFVQNVNSTAWDPLLNRVMNRDAGIWRDSSIEESHANFPVTDKYGLPARGMLVLLVAFAVIIGPLNFVVLARKNRRMWLLWTVPTISLATALTVFGYATFSEGWKAKVRCETVTFLDQRTHDAATFGYLGVYSSLTPGGGLHFSYDTEVWPEIEVQGYRQSSITSRSIDLTRDQHLTSGWVSARVPAYFKVRKAEQRRERLAVEREADGGLAVTNGLGAAITELHLTDAQGNVYDAELIPAGARVKLTPSVNHGTWSTTVFHDLMSQDWRHCVAGVVGNAAALRRPNSYIAVLEGTPFMEQPLPGASEFRGVSAVFGILEDHPAESP